jgi:hypothetical protein
VQPTCAEAASASPTLALRSVTSLEKMFFTTASTIGMLILVPIPMAASNVKEISQCNQLVINCGTLAHQFKLKIGLG